MFRPKIKTKTEYCGFLLTEEEKAKLEDYCISNNVMLSSAIRSCLREQNLI